MIKATLLLLTISASLYAKSHIVLFKQAEVALSSLDHGAFQNLLQSANQKSVTQLQDWLGSRGVRGTVADLWLVRGAVIDIEEAQAKKLEREPWVRGVYPDKIRKLVSPRADLVVGNTLQELGEEPENLWGLNRIRLPELRAAYPELNGNGIRVGILDTGIQSRHPELPGGTKFKDFVSHLSNAYDDHGHGTHVAGTIGGKKVGIAPNVQLITAKIFGAAGSGADSVILKAMQWVFDPDGNPATNDFPHLVSNSWGGDLDPSKVVNNIEEFLPFHTAIQAWIYGGVIPVFAAGNSGTFPNGFPGGLPDPIAVGALDLNGNMADFSSRGPNLWRVGDVVMTLLKPDISAPGVKITSAFPGNKYATWAGTSMATPHVSGTVALMLQANPKLRFADVKEILVRASEKKADIAYGYGILNAFQAVKLALTR